MSDTILAVLVGGAIATVAPIVVEWLRGQREAGLDAAKRGNDRQIERDRIQRDTLLELQPAFTEWLRAIVLIANQDRRTLEERGQLFQLPEGMSDAAFESGRRLIYLTNRVRDDELRGLLGELRSRAASMEAGNAVFHGDVTTSTLRQQAEELIRQGSVVQDKIGEVLRRYL